MSVENAFIERLATLSRTGKPFASVTTVEVVGSTPQDVGSKMLVDLNGLVSGTVGGGKVEQAAIQFAQSMMTLQSEFSDSRTTKLVRWNLKRDIGMTCGGTVALLFEAFNVQTWTVCVFGAGHVAQAVIRGLELLSCNVVCVDSRKEWLDKLIDYPALNKILAERPADHVEKLPSDAQILCMTMGHASDLPIIESIFRSKRTFSFVGVIGSKAKRAVLCKELAALGIDREKLEKLNCPIGLKMDGELIGNNQPGEIAISVLAQLVYERQKGRAQATTADENNVELR